MANLRETSVWETGVYQLETSDPVMGGENGISNRPLRQLANRTAWLKSESAHLERLIGTNLTAVNQGLADKVDKTTQVTTGAGLTGGGTLAGNIQIQMGTPGKLNGTTTNWVGSNTHTHEIDKASPTVAGVVKLINNLTSGGTDAALTAEQGKALSDLVGGKANKATTLSGYGIIDAATAASVTALSNTKADKATSFAGYGITGNQTISGGRLIIDGTTYPSVVLQSAVGASDLWLESSGSSHYFVLRAKGEVSGGTIIQLPSSAGTLATFGATLAHYGITDAATITQVTQAAPPGSIMYFCGNTAPAGWIKANGAAVSRTTYAALYAAIGTAYGAGNGSSTFNVPDLRGEFVRGWDDSRGVDAGRILGSTQSDQLRSHTHGGVPGYNIPVAGQANGNNVSGAYTVNPGQTQAAGGNETRPRNVALLACIKI